MSIILFWASTLLPGMALASLPVFRIRRTGVLGALCWWFVLSLGPYTLLTVLAFAFTATVAPIAGTYTAITTVSLMVLLKQRRRMEARRQAVAIGLPAVWIALCLVIAALFLPGANRFDAQMHAAKVVLQQVNGFSLQDPFSPLQVAHSAFHVNVMHVLHGIGVHLTNTPPLDFWRASGPFFRLVEFGGVQLLALYVFRSTFMSALAVIASAPLVGLESDNAVPASIAAYALLPTLLLSLTSHVVRASRQALFRLVACSLVLPAVHVGHAVLYIACLLPGLAASAIIRRWRMRQWSPLGQAALAMAGPTFPFLAITMMHENHALEQMGAELSWELTSFHVAGVSLQTINVGIQHWILPATAATLLLLLVSEAARRRFLIGASALLVALQLMFNPVVFRAASWALPFWMMRRVSAFAALSGFVAAAGLASMCSVEMRRPRRRTAVAAVAACAVVGFSTDAVVNRARRLQFDTEMAMMGSEVREILRSIPGRPLVAADPELSLLVPAIRLAAVMAPSLGNTNPADPQLIHRARARDELLRAASANECRQELVRRYGVDVLLVRRGDMHAGALRHDRLIGETPNLLAYTADCTASVP